MSPRQDVSRKTTNNSALIGIFVIIFTQNTHSSPEKCSMVTKLTRTELIIPTSHAKSEWIWILKFVRLSGPPYVSNGPQNSVFYQLDYTKCTFSLVHQGQRTTSLPQIKLLIIFYFSCVKTNIENKGIHLEKSLYIIYIKFLDFKIIKQ